jgi:quinoprotein glucose dehydrogenase
MNKRMDKLFSSFFIMVGLVILMSCASVAQKESSAGVLQGAYTSVQAERGSTAFNNICRNCHVPRDFRNILQQSDNVEALISDYFELITLTMPQDSPGSLSEDMYLDVMAYLLSINGFAATSE